MKTFNQFIKEDWKADRSSQTYAIEQNNKVAVIGFEEETPAGSFSGRGSGVFVGYNDSKGSYQKKFFGSDQSGLTKAKQFAASLGFPSPTGISLTSLKALQK